jgi:energy-coupling factor transporter ATP-binding protein EcfA2
VVATGGESPAGPGRPVLSVRGLGVRYPGAAGQALGGVTFEVAAGELVGLAGHNGAGKTTLCRCLNGIVPQLVEADVQGSVLVAGLDATTTPVRTLARVVGMALDEPATQLSQGTVGEEIALGMESLAVPWEAMTERVDGLLGRLGLAGMADRAPRSLSGGQQQRVLLASVLAMRPAVLVLDEATSGLDPATRADVLQLLRGLATADGTAILVVEHDVELLAEHVDRLLVLHDGELVADGPPGTVLADIPSMEAAGVGVPAVTAVAAAILGDAGDAPPGTLPVTLAGGLRRLGGLS